MSMTVSSAPTVVTTRTDAPAAPPTLTAPNTPPSVSQAGVTTPTSHTTGFDPPRSTPVQLDGTPQPITCMGPPARPTLAVTNMTGEQVTAATNKWHADQGRKPEYLAATLDPAVARDAQTYLASNPEVRAAANRMLETLPSGLLPGQVQRFETDFALGHYAAEGQHVGMSWPAATKNQAQALADAAVREPLPVEQRRLELPSVSIAEKGRTSAGVLTEYNSNGREGVSFGAAVSTGTHTVVNVDGRNNHVDFATNPYPSSLGRGDAVLGGTSNQGRADLVGTVLVRAGEANAWTINDPSTRVPTGSRYHELERSQLQENARSARVVLEGNAADWSVRVDANHATYVNARTGTSVQLPAGAQGRVSYLDSAQVDGFARDLIEGRGVSATPPTTAGGTTPVTQPATQPSTQPTTAPGATPTGGVSPGAVSTSPPVTGADAPQSPVTKQADKLEDLLMALMEELFADELTNELAKRLDSKLEDGAAGARGGRSEDASTADGPSRRGGLGRRGNIKRMLQKMVGLTEQQATKVMDLLGLAPKQPLRGGATIRG